MRIASKTTVKEICVRFVISVFSFTDQIGYCSSFVSLRELQKVQYLVKTGKSSMTDVRSETELPARANE